MADNAIDVIREAEAEAEEILLRAARESERIKARALAEAAHASELAEAAAGAAAGEAGSAAREKSVRIQREAEASLAEELDVLRQKAAPRQEQAIGALMAALVEQTG